MSKTIQELQKEILDKAVKDFMLICSNESNLRDFIKEAMTKTAKKTIKAVEVGERGQASDLDIDKFRDETPVYKDKVKMKDLMIFVEKSSQVVKSIGFNQAVQEQKKKANKFLGL